MIQQCPINGTTLTQRATSAQLQTCGFDSMSKWLRLVSKILQDTCFREVLARVGPFFKYASSWLFEAVATADTPDRVVRVITDRTRMMTH